MEESIKVSMPGGKPYISENIKVNYSSKEGIIYTEILSQKTDILSTSSTYFEFLEISDAKDKIKFLERKRRPHSDDAHYVIFFLL